MLGKKLFCAKKASLSFLVVSLLLTACGQKGDLYLPEGNKHVVTSSANTSVDGTTKANVPNIDPTVQNPNISLDNSTNQTAQPTTSALQGGKNDY